MRCWTPCSTARVIWTTRYFLTSQISREIYRYHSICIPPHPNEFREVSKGAACWKGTLEIGADELIRIVDIRCKKIQIETIDNSSNQIYPIVHWCLTAQDLHFPAL
ncbi:Uncharacterized protein HZ326_31636 [Fusarium oxysporum f. sp. albedinis]|nr:Uncharacterized protein HZ326_31636 [Fusarium oxysporum f. sp. albedinis]